MISEVDIRDWDRVDFRLLEKANVYEGQYNPVMALVVLQEFIDQVQEVYKKQTRHIPALEKK